MRTTWLVGLAGALTIGLMAGGVASSAPSGTSSGGNPPSVNSSSSTAAEVSPEAFSAAQLSHDNTYKVINPCRIVDSRSGGSILAMNDVRTFQVTGTTGFAPQGGKSGGCGIPAGAVSVTASVLSIGSTGGGRLRLWAADQTEPQILSMIFQKGQENAQALTYGISASGRFNARSMFGSTHLVVDVTGYYLPPVYGVFNSTGSVVRQGGLALYRHSTGIYILKAPRSINTCAVAVTAWDTYHAEGYISGQYLYVTVSLPNGTLDDAYFQAIVTC